MYGPAAVCEPGNTRAVLIEIERVEELVGDVTQHLAGLGPVGLQESLAQRRRYHALLSYNSSNLIRQSLLVSETEPGAGRGSHPELGPRPALRRNGDHE